MADPSYKYHMVHGDEHMLLQAGFWSGLVSQVLLLELHHFQWEFQDPEMGWYKDVQFFRPYCVGRFSEIKAWNIGQTYMVGTSNQSDPEMAIDSSI